MLAEKSSPAAQVRLKPSLSKINVLDNTSTSGISDLDHHNAYEPAITR